MEELIFVLGYCRTSGEGQRDNTSIPHQQREIEALCKLRGWKLVRFFIDESKSGSNIENRSEYDLMIQTARKMSSEGKTCRIIVFDISRLNRCKIVERADWFRDKLGVAVLDTKGFDNSQKSPQQKLMRDVVSAVKEFERLNTMDLMITARVNRAKEGKPWCGNPPRLREYDKKAGTWRISEKGKVFQEIARRMVHGESVQKLCDELGFPGREQFSQAVRFGNLSGVVVAKITCAEVGIDEQIPMPMIPEILEEDLLEAVKATLLKNRCAAPATRKREYPLGGFVFCGNCGKALTGTWNRPQFYYRHKEHKEGCFQSVRCDVVEPLVLDYLYSQFLDKPSFDQAIQNALPTESDRKELRREIDQLEKKSRKDSQALANIAKAIAGGMTFDELVNEQKRHKERHDASAKRLEELYGRLADFKAPEILEAEADAIRATLSKEFKSRDWRGLPKAEVRRFLTFLFGPNPGKEDLGVKVFKQEDRVWCHLDGRLDPDGAFLDCVTNEATDRYLEGLEGISDAKPPLTEYSLFDIA